MSAEPLAPSPVRTAELLMDEGRLSDLIGRPVHATHLRPKPGLSTVAAVVAGERGIGERADDVNDAIGWVQVCEPGHVDKLRNAVRRAGDRGRDVVVRPVGDSGLWMLFGDLGTDPRLSRGFDDVVREFGSWDAAFADASLVRYNPLRRILVRVPQEDRPDRAIRISHEKDEAGPALVLALARSGLPVVQALPGGPGVPSSARTRMWEWFGDGDLSRIAETAPARAIAGARRAGEALADLHRFGTESSPKGWTSARLTWSAGHHSEQLNGVAESLRWWGGGLAERATALRGLLEAALTEIEGAGIEWLGQSPTLPVGLVHGDFSADQVLLDGTEHIGLIDFDRAGVGPFGVDLGSWAAAEWVGADGADTEVMALPLFTAMLDGYRRGEGPAPTGVEQVRTYAARSLYLRVTEPLRAGYPGWRAHVAQRLGQVEAMLP